MNWISDSFDKLEEDFLDYNIEMCNIPEKKSKKFEALVLAEFINNYLEAGYEPQKEVLDLSRINQMPYRRVTQGAEINLSIETEDLVNWASPIFEVSKNGNTLSFFREGTPFERERLRPDILIYPAEFRIEEKSHPLLGDGIELSWDGEKTGSYRYACTTDQKGPIRRKNEGKTVSPKFGVEISLNKSCDRLKQQIDTLQELGSKQVEVLLGHENPCDDIKKDARVWKVESYNQLTDAISNMVFENE